MSDNPFANVLSGVIIATSKANPQTEDDYIKDGLLYCGKCNTPKQHRFTSEESETLAGRVVSCICRCKAEAIE